MKTLLLSATIMAASIASADAAFLSSISCDLPKTFCTGSPNGEGVVVKGLVTDPANPGVTYIQAECLYLVDTKPDGTRIIVPFATTARWPRDPASGAPLSIRDWPHITASVGKNAFALRMVCRATYPAGAAPRN